MPIHRSNDANSGIGASGASSSTNSGSTSTSQGSTATTATGDTSQISPTISQTTEVLNGTTITAAVAASSAHSTTKNSTSTTGGLSVSSVADAPGGNSTSSSSGSSHVGAIAGGTAAAAVAVLAALLFLLCRKRHFVKNRLNRKASVKPDPFLTTGHGQSTAALGSAEMRRHPNEHLVSYTAHPNVESGNVLAHHPYNDSRRPLATVKTDGLMVYHGPDAEPEDPAPNSTQRPPTYVPSRHPYVSPIASGKMSDVSPLPSSSTDSPDENRNTDALLSMLPSGGPTRGAGIESRQGYHHWLPGIPSEFGDDAPPRYHM